MQEDKNALLQSDMRTESILRSMPTHFKNMAPGGCVITATTAEVWQVLDRSIPDGKFFFKQSSTASSGYEFASAVTFRTFQEVQPLLFVHMRAAISNATCKMCTMQGARMQDAPMHQRSKCRHTFRPSNVTPTSVVFRLLQSHFSERSCSSRSFSTSKAAVGE